MKKHKKLEPVTIVNIIGNVISVVGVVLCNKYINATLGFKFTMFLSTCHFAFTWFGCYLLLIGNVFEYRHEDIQNVLPLAIGSLGSVGFMNLNLAHNSVGFYQLSKLACIPFTIFIQYFFYNISEPALVKLTLFPILFGIGIATVHDVEVNMVGTIFACVAVLFTTCSQIFTKEYQRRLSCNALQLLYLTSPIIMLGMMILIPFFDDIDNLMNYNWTWEVVSCILLSCCLALEVNISNYLVLGKTSPLTYQVLGHVKTILLLIISFYLFSYKLEKNNIMGIAIAMGGVIAYSEVKRRGSSLPILPLFLVKINNK